VSATGRDLEGKVAAGHPQIAPMNADGNVGFQLDFHEKSI